MRMQSQGVFQTGVEMLDRGIKDIEVMVVDGVVHVYATTGRNGGISGYAINPDGSVAQTGQFIFPPNMTAGVSDNLILAEGSGGPRLFFSADASGLMGLALTGGGGFGASGRFSMDQGAGMIGNGDWMRALTDLTDDQMAAFPGVFDCAQIVSLDSITVGNRDFVVTTCAGRNGVTVFSVDPSTGNLIEISTLGADEGIGISAPTAMQVIELNGQVYVLVGGAGSGSLSVMRLLPNGQLEPSDHVLDNGSTLFDDVQAIEAVTIGDHAFVVAGGGDNGVSLFLLLPDGRLMFLQAIADNAGNTLHSVSAIRIVPDGDTLHIFVGSQNDSGLTHLTIDLSSLGALLQGTNAPDTLTGTWRDDILWGIGADDTLDGGGGDDVLIATGDGTRMTGGNGADIFVIRDGSGLSTITDFRAGEDRLDLTDLPMLRDLSQLGWTITGNGLVLEYRGHIIRVISADGRPLSLSDLFPGGLLGGDHVPYIPIAEDPGPGIVVDGDGARNLINGTDLSDTLRGGGGHDTLNGGDGNDSLEGGARHDRLTATGGDNYMDGGFGRDTLIAGDGNDYLVGGFGRDRLFGGGGNDTLIGGSVADRLYAGDGDDLLILHSGRSVGYGGDGDDTVEGGTGDDRIYGMRGNDSLNGGDGNDGIAGGRDNDFLDGGNGNDRLYGELGDDSLRGGNNDDSLWGGDGNDTLMGDWGNDYVHGGDGNDIVNGGPGNDTLVGSSGYDFYWGGAGADVFEFGGRTGTARIMDFNLEQGDSLRLARALWSSQGTLTEAQMLDRFGRYDANGNVVLDFSDTGGGVLIFVGVDDLSDLSGVFTFF